ncbi:MAG TPA: hypothetical protein DDY79_01465 [Brevundimonas sp.]|uniref:hypothetical protein n=1 Tax=Brevundimonas sp. TaxID=1871086 RepID=UPI000E906496|nr:hypothetical protein [Brevundimonas sp.]HBI17998.1 hypothetical protein [Brevundimonas sp.]
MAALPENDRIAGPFIALAGQTDFPADFPLIKAEGLRARIERGGVVMELSGDDLAAVDDGPEGFTCRLVIPALANDRCWIYSRLPAARLRQHTPNGAVRTLTLEGDAVEAQAQLQELAREMASGLRTSVSDPIGQMPFDRAGRFLAFDAERQPIAALGTVPGVPATAAAALLLDDATFGDMRETLGADKGENVSQAPTAAEAQAAPALSLARAGRQVVDVLRRVPDLAFARAGLLDIAPYVQAEMNDWGAAEYVLDRGLFQWNSRVDVPSGAEFRAASHDAKIRPGPALGAASAGGAAIRLTQPNSGVRALRFVGSQMAEAACVLLDVGSNPINDTFCVGCAADDVAAFWWDRGAGDGTAGVGRHYLTNVQGNTVRRSRGVAFRSYYGFGFLNFNRNNTVDRNGSSAPNNLAFDASGAALSALPAAGGLFVDVVVLGTASDGATAGQQSFRFKSLTEITLQEGTSSDGAGGVAYEFDACRLVRPQYIIAAFGNDHAVIFRNVETVDGGRIEQRGRQGLPGASANKDAVRLEGANANFEIERIKSDGATGNAFNRTAGGNSLIHIERLAGRNGGRRMLQLSGDSGSFTCAFASSVNNNLTGVDATANYEATSAADKIPNFQLPSGAVVAVTAPGAG